MIMARVDYDDVAATFDERYARYDWQDTENFLPRFGRDGRSAVEVACGTSSSFVSGAHALLRTAPNGDVFLAESDAGRVRVLRDSGSGRPPPVQTFVSGLTQPYGIAFYPGGPDPRFVYIATMTTVVRSAYENGDLIARGRPEVIVPELPRDGHVSRDIAFSLDDRSLLIAVGSASA